MICVGDSYTEGIGATADESWPVLLEAALGAAGFEILNLGDAGAGAARYAEIVAEVALPLHPTHVIVCFNTSDLFGEIPSVPNRLRPREDFRDAATESRRPWLRPFAKLFRGWFLFRSIVKGQIPNPRALDNLYWRGMELADKVEDLSRKVALAEHVDARQARGLVQARLATVSPRVKAAAVAHRFNPAAIETEVRWPFYTYRIGLTQMMFSPDELQQAIEHWLAWYKSLAEAYGFHPYILYYLRAAEVIEGSWGVREDRDLVDHPHAVHDHSMRDWLAQNCRLAGVTFLDPTAAIEADGRPALYHRYDTHPQGACHRIVANVVAEVLQTERPQRDTD